MIDEFSAMYGEIKGFLYAFECINGKADHSYTFSLEMQNKEGSPEEIIKKYFNSQVKCRLELEKLENWEAIFLRALKYWLFEYLYQDIPHHLYITDRMMSYTLSTKTNQEAIVLELIKKIKDCFSPTKVWNVKVNPLEYYDHGVDFALENTTYILFLHIGVSD